MNNVRLGKTQKDKFRKVIQEHVEQTQLVRINNNVCESEADFFAGAMSVLMKVNEIYFGAEPDNVMDICPPMWFIGPMSGRKLSDNWGLDK